MGVSFPSGNCQFWLKITISTCFINDQRSWWCEELKVQHHLRSLSQPYTRARPCAELFSGRLCERWLLEFWPQRGPRTPLSSQMVHLVASSHLHCSFKFTIFTNLFTNLLCILFIFCVSPSESCGRTSQVPRNPSLQACSRHLKCGSQRGQKGLKT